MSEEKSETSDLTVTGGCLCGAIRYQASHRMSDAMACHCRRCQRLTGSAFLVMVLSIGKINGL